MIPLATVVVFHTTVSLDDPGDDMDDWNPKEFVLRSHPHQKITMVNEGKYCTTPGTRGLVMFVDDQEHYKLIIGEKFYQIHKPVHLEDYVHVCNSEDELLQHQSHSKVLPLSSFGSLITTHNFTSLPVL